MASIDPALDITQSSYNKFSLFPQASYNIASYLMQNDDFIWRLLKYESNDAWNSSVCSNLTSAEKGDLIWAGNGEANNYRVFFDAGMDASWTTVATVLRISPIELVPTNYVYGAMCIGFEVYSHATLSTMSNYATRNVSVIQRLIEVLNGADIEGIGRLYFNYRASSRCKVYLVGQTTYKGMALVMCNNALG